MGKSLIIAEKPSLSNTIQRALNFERWKRYDGYSESDNYICTNCFGHLLTLFDFDNYFNREKTKWSLGEIPFIPNVYKYKVKNDTGVKKQLNIIEDLIIKNDIDTIINAGDADAEGTKLVNLVIEFCFNKNKINKPIKRLWVKDQSEKSIAIEINRLRENAEFNNYNDEATARASIDWIVGINFSRGLTLIANSNIISTSSDNEANKNAKEVLNKDAKAVLLPQGRVIGCIVKHIYDRHIEQKNFIPKKYFNIGMNIENKNLSIILKDSIFQEDEHVKALGVLNELNRSNTFVSKIEIVPQKKLPKKLFSLTTLQNTVNKKHKIRNKSVLDATQSLYEKGYITYPRSSTEYLGTNSKENVKGVIEAFKAIYNNIEFKDSKTIFDNSKIDSHEAIIPTNKIPEDIKGTEKIVYETIRNRFLSNFCTEECIIENKTVNISNSANDLVGQINGTKVLKLGFLKFDNIIEEKEIGNFSEGEKLIAKYVINECFTQAPKNINSKELSSFLESPLSKEGETEEDKYSKILGGLEIGTVATRDMIIENAIKYNYIEDKNGIYTITNKGIYFVETAKKLGLLMDVDHNVMIGKYLKAVFNKKITVNQCVEVIEKYVTSSINRAKTIKVDSFTEERELIGVCPECRKTVYESEKAFYCEGFKDKSCNFAISKKDRFMSSKGKTVTKSIAKSLIKNGLAKVKDLTKIDGKTKYDAYIKLVKNENFYNIRFADKEDIPVKETVTCPRCDRNIYESEKSFYCSGYRDEKNKCNYTVWKTNKFLSERNIKLTNSNYKNLIKGKKILVKDIERKEKPGKYNSYVYLEDTGTYVNYKFEMEQRS